MMTQCIVGKCTAHVHSQHLCQRHYDAIRRSMIRDGDWRSFNADRSTSICCTCRSPKWDTCGVMFPSVHVCRWCGSPSADEFGLVLA